MLERRRLLTVTEATRGVHVTAVSRAVLLAAADVRAKTNLKTPDAVVAGSAIVAGCGAIVGNDKSFERLARVDKDAWVMFDSRVNPVPAYVHLDDFVD
jgi:predicted nucleic acid-binding protein